MATEAEWKKSAPRVEIFAEEVDPVIDVFVRGPPESMKHVEKSLGRRLCFPVSRDRLPKNVSRGLKPLDSAIKCRIERSRVDEIESIAKESADAFSFEFTAHKIGIRKR